MKCPSCNLELGENAKFCPICGAAAAPVQAPPAPPKAAPAPKPETPQPVSPAPQPPVQKLMGPWAYVGWQLLFSIPLVGFILLIVFSFDNDNLNLRNFARSYWCAMLLGVILFILFIVAMLIIGTSFISLTETFTT